MEDETCLTEISISEAPLPMSLHHQVPVLQRAVSPEETNDSSMDPGQDADTRQIATRNGPPNGDKIPYIVTYSLHITFEGQEVLSNCKNAPIHPSNLSNFEYIGSKAEECVKAQFDSRILAGRSLNFRHGEGTITCKKNDNSLRGKCTHYLSAPADWEDLYRVLINLWASSGSQDIQLDIQLEYFGLLMHTVGGKGFTEAKRLEIFGLMKTAFDGNSYLPRLDVLRVASRDMIRGIITEDPTIQAEEKEIFIQEVWEKAPKLLVMFVLGRMKMSCLKLLVERGQNDSTNPLEEEHCCHKSCTHDFVVLLQCYCGGLDAATFFRNGEHQKLRYGTVLPIHYHPEVEDPIVSKGQDTRGTSKKEFDSDEEKEDSDEYKAFCGSSTYSRVYRVRLDPAHHSLTKDKNAIFALKQFRDCPHRTVANFEKELELLKELLRLPNEHVVLHLATWTRDREYYILSPYAECNLMQYMERHPFLSPTKRNVLWLLAQILGLSSALRDIHNLSNSETGTDLAPRRDPRLSEWHHDLKPENIYYFKGLAPNEGTFKIANLGSSVLYTYRVRNLHPYKRWPKNTPTYEPPEAAKEGAASRPYDVWSMGCLFLGMLIWAVYDFDTLERFRRSRDAKRFPDDASHYALWDDAFWQIDSLGTIRLRDSVGKMLGDLGKELHHRNMRPFQEVLGLVIRMLDIDKETRITAADLWDALSCIESQARADLEIYEDDSMLGQDTFRTTQKHKLSLPAKESDHDSSDLKIQLSG